jgi:hypothetical protein
MALHLPELHDLPEQVGLRLDHEFPENEFV